MLNPDISESALHTWIRAVVVAVAHLCTSALLVPLLSLKGLLWKSGIYNANEPSRTYSFGVLFLKNHN